MNDKYTLAEDTKTVSGYTLHRIKALKDFAHARVGQLGGWIETEKNLSGSGDSWVAAEARVFGDAQVFGDALASGKARVSGRAPRPIEMPSLPDRPGGCSSKETDAAMGGITSVAVKPVDDTRLVTSVQRAVDYGEIRAENSLLKTKLFSPALRHPEAFARIVTRNASMHGIFKYVEAISSTGLPILIVGETGVGKELIAHATHEVSGRGGLFVPVNAAGLDDTLFSDTLFGHMRGAFTGADKDHAGLVERASKGTLFLDEIGDLSLESQVKLLRFLQEGEFYPLGASKPAASDARFVFATSHDLLARARKGLFRQDLYYRLQSHLITIPPLRERKSDIPILTHHFLRQAALLFNRPIPTVSGEIIHLLERYSFPGNVRELEGMVSDALVSSSADSLSLDYFERKTGCSCVCSAAPSYDEAMPMDDLNHIPGTEKKPQTLKEFEEQLILEAIKSANGNKTRAAAILGISRQALCNRLSRKRQLK